MLNAVEEICEMQQVIVEYKAGKLREKMLFLMDALQQHPAVLENGELIQKSLLQMLAAYENKDYVMLCDVLEFSLKPLLEASGQV